MVGYDTVESGSSPAEGAVEAEREHVIEDRPRRWKRVGFALLAVCAVAGVVQGVSRAGRAPTADFAAVSEAPEVAAVTEEPEVLAADTCEHCIGGGECGGYVTKKKCKHEGHGCTWKPNRCGTRDDDSAYSYSYSYGDSAMMI